MFSICRNCVVLIFALSLVVYATNAGYASEEINEKSNSEFREVTSISGSKDSSRHHRVRTYDGAPCLSGGCKLTNEPTMVGVFNPCFSATGCSPSQQNHPGYIGGGYTMGPPYMNNGSGGKITDSHGNYNQADANRYRTRDPCSSPSGCPPSQPGQPSYVGGGYPSGTSYISNGNGGGQISGGHGNFNQPSPQNSYNQPINQPSAYPYWNGNYNNNGYQGPRGYSAYNHSLKVNSEYTETGSHTGPLQQQRPGYGYGSGYGGGYNGLFNRPGF